MNTYPLLTIPHVPAFSMIPLFKASEALTRLGQAEQGDLVGLRVNAEKHEDTRLVVEQPLCLVWTGSTLQEIPLSTMTFNAGHEVIACYATLMEDTPFTIDKTFYRIGMANSSPDEGYDIRTFYLFNKMAVLLDTIHHPDGDPEAITDRSAAFIDFEDLSAHERMERQPDVRQLETLINTLVDESVQHAHFSIDM